MELIFIFFFLFLVVAIVTVTGHVIWLMVAYVFRALRGLEQPTPTVFPRWTCLRCTAEVQGNIGYCQRCDAYKPGSVVLELVRDLAATERQIERFNKQQIIDAPLFEFLKQKIQAEYERLKAGRQKETPPAPVAPQAVVRVNVPLRQETPAQVSTFKAKPPAPEVQPPLAPKPKRRSFSEVLNSFMEESNIRWGEIIGGLLIIGCSTALVVSLWAQISEIPVLKFLIFTTVTAVLFGIGLYTEHRWKLPTTSRGILTIATLLVPLNFLAIAAVSLSGTSGSLVLASEVVAPAIFLCLVYFAGRVITPRCGHLLSAGVLSSSVGQLLVRHFALDAGPLLMVLLGAFPVLCYVVVVALVLRIVLADREITEAETTSVFTMLGIMSFAALLPFGLLLYRSGPLSWSMMYLAPIVTLWGIPMLATGSALWGRIQNPELIASRIAGSALALLGTGIVVLGTVLAWPNPSSIVPAALMNFAVFTALAILFKLRFAHILAASHFALAYLVSVHVATGNISWQNLRVASLVEICLTVSSGQALVGLFALFVIVSEWLARRGRMTESRMYQYSACAISILSLGLVTLFGWWNAEYQHLWLVFGFYAISAFVFATHLRQELLAWVASFLLLFTCVDLCSRELLWLFPWQTSLLVLSTITAATAIIASRDGRLASLVRPLNLAAIVSLTLAVISLFQTNPWQVTSMQAGRMFWIAGILATSLWLNRYRLFLNALQIALTVASVLTVKAVLQQYDWYSYLAHAFVHPAALQIQGMVLILLCLMWITVRFLAGVRHASARRTMDRGSPLAEDDKLKHIGHRSLRTLLDGRFSVDRFILWGLVPALLLLVMYGSLSGITQELTVPGSDFAGFNIAGFPHTEAFGLGAWVLLGLLLIALLATFVQRRQASYLYGAIATAVGVVPLLAAQFESEIAVATALRWFAALFLLAGSILIWLRSRLEPKLVMIGIPAFPASFYPGARFLLLALTVIPLGILTLYPALRAINYLPVQSPVSGFFSLPGDAWSYGVPLLITAMVLIGYAIRERLSEFAFYAGLLLNATVTLAYLLSIVSVHGAMDRVVLVQLIQLNAITSAAYVIPWLATRQLWSPASSDAQQARARTFQQLNLIMALICNVLLIVSATATLVIFKAAPGFSLIEFSSLLGWMAFLLTSLAAAWWITGNQKKFGGGVLVGWLAAISCLIAAGLADDSRLVAIRALAVGLTLASWISLVLPKLEVADRLRSVFNLETWEAQARFWAARLAFLAVCVSLISGDRWWSISTILCLSLLYIALNWLTYKRRFIYAAGLLLHLASSIWWVPYFLDASLTDFLHLQVIVAALGGIAWLLLELRSRKLGRPRSTTYSFHNLLAVFATASLALMVFFSFDVLLSQNLTYSTLAFVSTFVLLLSCLWDPRAKYSVAFLYLLTLVAGAFELEQSPLSPEKLAWSWVVYSAAITLVSALLWRYRTVLLVVARRLKIPRRIHGKRQVLDWLGWATGISVATVFGLVCWLVTTSVDLELRATAALALTSLAVGLALLADGSWRQHWQRGAVGVFVAGAILIAWSALTPGLNATWLNRSVILMLTTFGLTAIYAIGLRRMRSFNLTWSNAVKFCIPFALGAGLAALCFSLSTEVFYQISFGAVRVHSLVLLALGGALIAAIFLGLLFALSPQHDPLGLTEQQRMGYVYTAEVMTVLLFLHIRLAMPWLFSGMVERYWPVIVMAVAYLGVVASEALRRRQLLVLSKPLERTGAFLPLLPVLGFWIVASEVDFSLVLFAVGGLYGLLAILRRSFGFGVVAAVAGNGALWYMWHRTDDYQFFQHPQLWLIPVALSVLLAAYLNEERLTEDQMAGVRYLSLVTLYVASTADIFINGVVNSPWLPLILASLSLAGVFGGILFRIRGMLLLGSVFLLLSIVTMIWYGAENFGWTWLWYVAGIATGATIIFMFAIFEKKRSEVLRVVDGLKDWDR